MRYWIALATVLSLTGCKTIDQIHADDDDKVCMSYGVPKGSPAYVECRLNRERGRADVQAATAGRGGLVSTVGR